MANNLTIQAKGTTQVFLRSSYDKSVSKSSIWVERRNFYGALNPDAEISSEKKPRRKKKKKASTQSEGDLPETPEVTPYLVIGFDTEFKTPADPLTRPDLYEGKGKYEVLSYQVACKVFDPSKPDQREWSGICYPADSTVDGRLSLSDIVTFAIWRGVQSGVIAEVPRLIYLVGHFTRADIPALSDFQTLTKLMSSVRSTFLSIDNSIPITFDFEDERLPVTVNVLIRDTMLLTPAASKGLKALGELVGVDKVTLSDDPEKELFYKRNMDRLMEDDPELFEKYAITDAEICLRYVEQLADQYMELLGVSKIPVTLTSIGLELLWKSWVDQKLDPLFIVGKEEVKERKYNKKYGRYERKTRKVPIREVFWHLPIATECYHGGRNEQFWYGPCFEGDWTDYDLTSAYPTAMALIKMPRWRECRYSEDLDDFTPTALGFCCVEFDFPEHVRFPTLPVRTDNGLVFPRSGASDCSAPELCLARSLGATLKIKHGVIVPTEDNKSVFFDFIKDCIGKRSMYPKKTLKNLFWKELSNSTYGKTAQGLHEKRVYDMRERDTKPLPPSKITNPFYASFITSFVRSVLGEIINALPESVCVFSCTTDGFLTNASRVEMATASQGPLVALYRQSREALTDDPNHLEAKHHVRRPLGWRTRGQATLLPGTSDDPDMNVILAKGGIYLDEDLDSPEAQNNYIVDLFLRRTPEDKIHLKMKTGIRDIVELNTDLVEKLGEKRLNMEFDWKRRPKSAVQCHSPEHLAFSTVPWNSVDDFFKLRECSEDIWAKNPYCLKSIADFEHLAITVLSKTALGEEGSKNLNTATPDLTRLRQSLGAAWRHSKAGLMWRQASVSNDMFARTLDQCGISCTRADVENDARKPFVPHQVPSSPGTLAALKAVQIYFPKLTIGLFLAPSTSAVDMTGALEARCPMTDLLRSDVAAAE